MRKKVWLSELLVYVVLLTTALLVVVIGSKKITVFQIGKSTPNTVVTTPSPGDAWWTIIQDDAVGADGLRRAQVRGKFVSMGDGKLRLTTRDGVVEVVLPDQLQYKCMEKEMPDAHTGQPCWVLVSTDQSQVCGGTGCA